MNLYRNRKESKMHQLVKKKGGRERERGMEGEEGKLEILMKWASEIGISDSPTSVSDRTNLSSCLAHSLFVSHFPHAGGYASLNYLPLFGSLEKISCLFNLSFPFLEYCRRGLAAVRHLRSGELVLRVPKSALMTTESLSKDHRFSTALNAHSSLSPIQVFFSFLLSFVCLPRNYLIPLL